MEEKKIDSDGFGVEPDDWMFGVISPGGQFIVPFKM